MPGNIYFTNLTRGDHFVVDARQLPCSSDFRHYLTEKKVYRRLRGIGEGAGRKPGARIRADAALAQGLCTAARPAGQANLSRRERRCCYSPTATTGQHVINTALQEKLAGMQGVHPVVQEQNYPLQFHGFMQKLNSLLTLP